MPNTLTNLKRMPLELREGVYDEAIEPLQAIDYGEQKRETVIENFRNILPKPFSNDPQIMDEATTTFIRQTLRTVQEIKVPGSEYFEPVKSLVLQWDGVGRLEFTNIQMIYATFPDHDRSSSTFTIHDIVTRCPNLEVLIFRISSAFMLKQLTSASNPDRAQDSSACTHLLRIFEHPKIRRLELQCAEGRQTFTGFSAHADPEPPSTHDFKPFIRTFREAAKAAGRKIDLEVDFSPGVVKGAMRMSSHGLSIDFFG